MRVFGLVLNRFVCLFRYIPVTIHSLSLSLSHTCTVYSTVGPYDKVWCAAAERSPPSTSSLQFQIAIAIVVLGGQRSSRWIATRQQFLIFLIPFSILTKI